MKGALFCLILFWTLFILISVFCVGKLLQHDITQKTEYACKNCKIKLEYYKSNYDNEIYKDCYFDSLLYSYNYRGLIRRLLLDYKFKNKKYIHRFLAQSMQQQVQDFFKYSTNYIDYIIPVPISYFRFLERGYNQSSLLAKYISNNTKIPVLEFVLIKVMHNKKQSNLSHHDRVLNTKGVYKVLFKSAINGKSLLLIDDIYTTGATVNECARVLKQAGAKRVFVLVCARA